MSAGIAIEITPTRKRKRDSEKFENADACFINSAFSSTPKHIAKRQESGLKENKQPYNHNNNCMEVKSIAELVKEQNECKTGSTLNPYEVQRKPPKKKKRETTIEDACFENPALNLNGPEKAFNPFEVVRDIKDNREEHKICFVNEALNIKGQESTIRNPFEVKRDNAIAEKCSIKESAGVENLAHEDAPTSLKIGIPFTPTVGCRIDFNNVSLSQLTPNKLRLAEKLVFSPVPCSMKTKRSLDAISEESSTTSIGKELDRYQLELENSINEAKLRKNEAYVDCDGERVYQLNLKVEKRVSLSQRLTDIPEVETEEDKQIIEEIVKETPMSSELQTDETKSPVKITTTIETTNNNEAQMETEVVKSSSEEEEEEAIDFKAPAPFVRCYRRDIAPNSKLRNSKESLNSISSDKLSSECIAEPKTSVKGLIRKSIRKIMPKHKQQTENHSDPVETKTKDNDKDIEPKQCTLSSHLMSSIRHSFRRKPKIPASKLENTEVEIPMAEISIIDTSERKMKLKSCATRNDYVRIEELTNEKKHLLRSGSLRRSMMKTIFHKQEEYKFQK